MQSQQCVQDMHVYLDSQENLIVQFTPVISVVAYIPAAIQVPRLMLVEQGLLPDKEAAEGPMISLVLRSESDFAPSDFTSIRAWLSNQEVDEEQELEAKETILRLISTLEEKYTQAMTLRYQEPK